MKKNKKEIVKRQAKSKEKARKKRQVRLTLPPPRLMKRPPISQVEAPKGFITVSTSQAMMEYAKPLMEINAENLDDLNRRMELASSLWNLAVSRPEDQQEYSLWLDRVKTGVKKVLNLEDAEQDRYIAEMIARQHHLFPEEMQPKPSSMFMFMRKEVSHLIPPFDAGRIRFRVDSVILPDEEDLHWIEKVESLDEHIRRGSDYEAYEELALSVEDESKTVFAKWLTTKGFEDDPEEYVHCPEIYLTFLYRYAHDEPVVLKSVPTPYLIEFFEDFLLRKMICEPTEYLYWPPSLTLFYRFLNEKGYLSANETDHFLRCLDALERHFLEILRERYH